jgi:predicted DsbA family dithiol-disulfide isomerase
MTSRIRFSYWSDPLCIWAYVAQGKLDRLLAGHARTLDVSYRVVPVFGSVRWRFEHGPWASEGVEGRVRKTAEIAHRFGHPEATGECWRAAAQTSSWSAGAAIKAVSLAQDAGVCGPHGTASYQLALRRSFFVDGLNIGLRSVQLAVAEHCGIAREGIEGALDDGRALAALWEDHQERETLGIQGSPTYVFDDGRAILYGNVSEGVINATVDELLGGTIAGRSECG